MRFEIAPVLSLRRNESGGLRSGCGAFFKSTWMNPDACDQIAFGQIIVARHGEKVTVNSVSNEGAEFAIAIFVT
ncbi:hypothetical protein NDI47_02440 [Microcoleus vaginatus GB1-A2]|uniref:hypothetical protein n=1 Tax=Microcoleus vaginatus TaxID=119532 RepID=UPI001688C0E2|nr:hypothetical protein [Microcoleus sp. FACHB-61]